MYRKEREAGRRRLTGLVVGAAVVLAASPVLARDDSTPVGATDEATRASTAPVDRDNPPAATLNIGYFDRAGVPDEVSAAMRAEVARLLGELGVAVNSLEASSLMSNESQPDGTLLNLIVWEQLPDAWDLPSNTMGVCPNAGGVPRSVYVFEANILEEIGLDSQELDSVRAEDVGRAFGRVIAHEVIHAFATFAGEHRHRGNGLMGARLDKETLLRPQLSVDQRSGDAFRTGLAKAAAH